MTFDEFLDASRLPPIGTIVTTPADTQVKVAGYSFGAGRYSAVIEYKGVYVDWCLDQFDDCTWEGK